MASSWSDVPDGGGRFDVHEELRRLRATNLLLSEECSALKEVLNTASLTANGECSRLREQVSTLFRENCSLKEHAAKLAIDGKTLKKQLATSNKDNLDLRDKLAQFSQQLKSVATKSHVTCDLSTPPLKNTEHGSLEEISNQLLEHLRQEKLELEQQYTQMVEIQNRPCSYNVTLSSSGDFAGTENDETTMTSLVSQLDACRSTGRLLRREAALQNRLLSALIEQLAITNTLQTVAEERLSEPPQRGHLKSPITKEPLKDVYHSRNLHANETDSLERITDSISSKTSLDMLLEKYDHNGIDTNEREKMCNPSTHDVATSPLSDDHTTDNRVCPMCQAVFPISIPLSEFEVHVMEHFRGESFEIIMHDGDDGTAVDANFMGESLEIKT